MPRRKAAPITNNDGVLPAKKSRPGRGKLYKIQVPSISNILGKALTCGQGDMGQLGLGESVSERKKPALIESIPNVVDVCAGGMHNLCLTKDGDIYSFGCNDEGALGRETSEEGSDFEPKKVALPGKCVKISAGDSHSACLLSDGRVFAWGSFRDSHGNMGLTLEGNKRVPVNVLPNIVSCDIASGTDHLVMLTENGKVYTIGCGEQGQLGRVSMRSASGESRRGKTELLQPSLVSIKRGSKLIEAIWATAYCTFLRERDTSIIWAFGLNNYKQLLSPKEQVVQTPVNTKLGKVQMIAGGQHHTLVLKNDGSVHAIGRHDYGRLGLGDLNKDVEELQHITALDGKKIVHISCGDSQSFALTDDGKLYSWGMGSNLQLGTGSEDDAVVPTLIVSNQTQGKHVLQASSGGQHSIFLVADEKPNTKVSTQLSDENSSDHNDETTKVNGDAVENEVKDSTTDGAAQKKGRKKK